MATEGVQSGVGAGEDRAVRKISSKVPKKTTHWCGVLLVSPTMSVIPGGARMDDMLPPELWEVLISFLFPSNIFRRVILHIFSHILVNINLVCVVPD